jgi:hypothetical protein
VHVVRVTLVPPLVIEPAGHALQLAAPAPLNLLSAPHGRCVLLPSHSWPGCVEQVVQFVRSLGPPPLVDEPAGHTLQLAAPLLNLLSAPHGFGLPPVPSHS